MGCATSQPLEAPTRKRAEYTETNESLPIVALGAAPTPTTADWVPEHGIARARNELPDASCSLLPGPITQRNTVDETIQSSHYVNSNPQTGPDVARAATVPAASSGRNATMPWEHAAAFGSKSSDMWNCLQRACDHLVYVSPARCASVVIFSTSRRYAKVVCNASSPQAVLCTRNELCPSAELPTVVSAIATCRPVQLNFTAECAKGQELGVDCQLLKDEAGCTSFVVIPLVFAKEVLGALMLAGSETLDSGWPNHWVASFWPWVAMYAAEVKAVRLVDLLEKIQTAPSLNSLAWVVTNELDDWFEWTVREHTEARLVLLSEDTSSALVLSHAMVNTKSRPAPMRCSSSLDPMMRTSSSNALAPGMTTDPTLIPHPAGWSGKTHLQPDAAAGLCKSAPTSGVSALPFGNDTGAVAPGPQLPLSKQPGLVPSLGASPATPFLCGDPGFALTARQLAEHGLLGTHMSLLNTLTRRCLMEGSKLLYVADVMAALKKYGEPWKDIFLDQARVLNPLWVIAAPIIANEKHLGAIIWLSNSRVNPAMLANAARTSVPPLLHSLAEQLQQVTQHVTQLRSQNSGMANDETPHFWDHLLSGTGLELGTAKNSVSSSHGLEILDFEYRPVKYSMAPSDAASTSALMKVYQSVIAQHQHAQTPPEFDLGAQYEEIEVIAKAGQGAFGSVYVAMWKGMLVAVKVMKQQLDGRRAMRTAWELAVTKALQHSNVVAVHMVLTDVLVEKFSKRIIRFIPSSLAADAQSSSWGSSMGVPTLSAAIGQDKESQPRCQVGVRVWSQPSAFKSKPWPPRSWQAMQRWPVQCSPG
ncbi:hypothetical protein V8C86DRAFT_466155 [Haematococcus lacustris]